MKRKHLIPALILGLILVLVFAVPAQAADQLKPAMEFSSNTFSGPKEITVSISITNVGESDLPGPVTLYYPSGKQVEEFGSPTLSVGSSKSWTGTWKVTQAELDAGKIIFKMKYSIYNDDGELVNITKGFSKKIVYSGAAPELTVNRTIKPTRAGKGQEVTVTYDITNGGGTDVTDVTIKENSAVSGKSGKIESIAAGETESYTFSTTMGSKDMTSSATITFKAGGKSYTQKVEAETIKYGEVKLSATLNTDKKGGAPGDVVKMTVKLKNTGNVDFTDVKLADENLGELWSGLTLHAGEVQELEKDLTITESRELQLTVTGVSGDGEPVETATGKVSVIATDPTQQVALKVQAVADRGVVYELPGTVRFTITVTNESAVEVPEIDIYAVNTLINTFDTIPAGESRSFTREMAVSMTGNYVFTATCKDQLGQSVTFDSTPLLISHEQPTPVPTEVPIPQPPTPKPVSIPKDYEQLSDKDKLDPVMEQMIGITEPAKWVFAGLAGILLLLLLIGAARRAKHKSHSNKAMDHLQGANYRDYGETPKSEKKRVYMDTRDDPKKSGSGEDAEHTAQDSRLMSETLERLYSENRAEQEKAAEVVTEEAVEEAPEAAPSEEPATEPEAKPEDGNPPAEGETHRRRAKQE